MVEKNNKKILMIDDNQELILGLNSLLKSQGYSTLAANDAIYGISLAFKETIDLIILDLGLPAGGGLYVLENLKSALKTNTIPILILTGEIGKEVEEKAYKLGAAAFLHKPFDPEELLKCIKEILDKS